MKHSDLISMSKRGYTRSHISETVANVIVFLAHVALIGALFGLINVYVAIFS